MLFEQNIQNPLAERMRPQKIEDFFGQQPIMGGDAPIRKMILNKKMPSLILWGPPGVGKTTLAFLIANELKRPFQAINAITSGVKEVREMVEFGKTNPGTILFIDEIHRFNKTQQDSLLNAVEKGILTLIGATTENPSFEVISALLSRCQLYILQALTNQDIHQILLNAIENDEILKKMKISLVETDAIYALSAGDARKALNILEVISQTSNDEIVITNELVSNQLQEKFTLYDKNGEQHYDVISAFIKSLRGSDPNGAIYWMARMIDAGEDAKFIARRMLILASEDIGNANPNALLLANTTFDAVSKIGMPEARIILAQCAIYLATSLKSNASYVAIDKALAFVHKDIPRPVPLHLRNAPTQTMKNLGYGKNYKYSHDYDIFDVNGNQQYLPEGIENVVFYQPKRVGKEIEISEFLKRKWTIKYPS